MIVRIVVVVALLAVAAFAVWRPAPHAPLAPVAGVPAPVAALPGAAADPSPLQSRAAHRAGVASAGSASRGSASAGEVVVYVVGAVRRPGLYRLKQGDRYARGVELAGGLSPAADARGVNLAQLAADGEEIDVPQVGESPPLDGGSTSRYGSRSRDTLTRSRSHRSRRHEPPPEGSVDINLADAVALAAVPGIGRSLGARIVELRDREGRFASLDELLDVSGMTASKLERARPYLREP